MSKTDRIINFLNTAENWYNRRSFNIRIVIRLSVAMSIIAVIGGFLFPPTPLTTQQQASLQQVFNETTSPIPILLTIFIIIGIILIIVSILEKKLRHETIASI